VSSCERLKFRRRRLKINRKQWRKDHPFGFWARPQRNAQGLLDLKLWECGIPGKEKTIWGGGTFKLHVIFPEGELLVQSHNIIS